MTIKVVEAPAFLPVPLADFKAWARIDDADDDDAQDALAVVLLKGMTAYAENLTGRAFVERTLQLILPCWPSLATSVYCGVGLELPHPPLLGVDAIAYTDLDGEEQTLTASLYVVHEWREPAIVIPAWHEIWPAVRGVPNAVRVTYRAGYPPLGSPAGEDTHQAGQPPELKLWIQARAATLWENREQLIASNQVEIPRGFADGLLDSLILGERIGA